MSVDGNRRLLRSVQRLGQAFGRLERLAAANQGVTVPQMRVLQHLVEGGRGQTVGELAQSQGVAVSTMTRNLLLLEREGLVSRTPGGDDRRNVIVELTDLGHGRARSIVDETLGRLGDAFVTFHPSDRIERAHALDRVAQALERIDERGRGAALALR